MAQGETVCVVGGGLVGPIAALFLAKRGYQVALYERGEDPNSSLKEGGRSVHLVVSERGWRTLRTVGLEDEVRKICMPLRGRTIHMRGGSQRFQPYGRDDQAIFAVQRSALNRMVAQAASNHPGIAAHFHHRCQDVDLDNMTLTFRKLDDATVTVTADRIIAADGAFSRVREALTHTERYDYSQEYMKYGYKELSMPCPPDGEYPLDHHTMHVWPRKRLLLTAFPNPNKSFTGMLVMPFEGDSPSFSAITNADQLMALFEQEFPDAIPLMPQLCEDYLTRPVSSLVTIHCYPWVYRDRVALIGDAAHAMVPFFGQGMNVGYEDCLVLNQCLEDHNDDWPTALAAYQQRRKPNCDAVTDMSLKNFIELSENVGNPEVLLQRRLEQRIHELYPKQFMPLYPMVAFSYIEYSDARNADHAQREVIQHIMKQCDVEACWGSAKLDEVIHQVMGGYRAPITF